MIVTIHQPEHLPWLGFFNKMSTAETFVVLDSVQFRKNYFQNRNKINGSNGPQWIGIPVETKGHMDTRICDIKIAKESNPKWRERYLRTINFGYKKHPYFYEYYPFFEQLFSKEYETLFEYNIQIISYFADLLDIHPSFIRSSELNISGLKTDLILDICKKIGAQTYVAGPSGRDYLNIEDFTKAGIKVVYNDFQHPVYEQYRQSEFIPYLSILDLFMNCGTEKAKNYICKTNYWNEY